MPRWFWKWAGHVWAFCALAWAVISGLMETSGESGEECALIAIFCAACALGCWWQLIPTEEDDGTE